jgi:hypothetical protein
MQAFVTGNLAAPGPIGVQTVEAAPLMIRSWGAETDRLAERHKSSSELR